MKEAIIKALKKELRDTTRIVFWKTELEGMGKYVETEDEDSVTITIKEMKDIWDKAILKAIKIVKAYE